MSTNPGYTGRYELQELLDKGGITEVWKAFDTQTHQYVAIKFLYTNLRADSDFANRFQREAQTLTSLRHPNIVRYYDFFISQPSGIGNTTASMVMDYVDGGTLSDYIHNTSRQGKFLPLPDIIRLFTSIGAALDYAHQQGVVHGQLKPANILLDQRNTMRNLMGEPIVADFGIAKLLATTTGHSNGWLLGTLMYMSPEQIMGLPGDARSDVYALGVILYEICAGTPPFPGSNPATIMMQHMNIIPVSPALINPGIPPALVTIIMRSVAKDPAQRFPSISAMMTELVQVAAQVGQQVPNLPISVNAGQAESAMNANLPTAISSGRSANLTPPSGMAPSPALPTSLSGTREVSFSPLPGSGYMPISSPGLIGISQAPTALTPGGPATPMPAMFSPGQVFSTGPSVLPSPNLLPPQAAPPRGNGRRRLWIIISILLILFVIDSGFVVGLLVHQTPSTVARTTAPIVGHAYFVSSGLLSANPDAATVQGITDQLEIKLENIPQPPSGTSYYGWLLNSKNLTWQPLPLGPLSVKNGTLVYAYPGDAQHSDLLATYSRFLITLGDIATPPLNPDSASLVYYASFSEVNHPFGTEQFSLYDHIGHLLANDPKVRAAGLTGGLDIWLYRNTEKILEWADSARDSDTPTTQSLVFLRRQLTRIIDYLDGDTYIQLQKDLPGQLLRVDPTIARIGLLTFDTVNQDPPGYLYHMEKHLHEIASLPESTATQIALALQIDQSINAVNSWDQTIRTDVLTLFHMSDAQLNGHQGLSLLDEVATLANTALVGQVEPSGQVTDGVVQIHYEIQRLATFDVQACTTHYPCPALV